MAMDVFGGRFQIRLNGVEHDYPAVAVELSHEIDRPGVNGWLEDLLLGVDPEPGSLGCSCFADFCNSLLDAWWWDGVTAGECFNSCRAGAGESNRVSIRCVSHFILVRSYLIFM